MRRKGCERQGQIGRGKGIVPILESRVQPRREYHGSEATHRQPRAY